MNMRAQVRARQLEATATAAARPARVRCGGCRTFIRPSAPRCPRCGVGPTGSHRPAAPNLRLLASPLVPVPPVSAPPRPAPAGAHLLFALCLWALGLGMLAAAAALVPWFVPKPGHGAVWMFWKTRQILERGGKGDRLFFGYLRVLWPVCVLPLLMWGVTQLRGARSRWTSWCYPVLCLGVVGAMVVRLRARYGALPGSRVGVGPLVAAGGTVLIVVAMVVAAGGRRRTRRRALV